MENSKEYNSTKAINNLSDSTESVASVQQENATNLKPSVSSRSIYYSCLSLCSNSSPTSAEECDYFSAEEDVQEDFQEDLKIFFTWYVQEDMETIDEEVEEVNVEEESVEKEFVDDEFVDEEIRDELIEPLEQEDFEEGSELLYNPEDLEEEEADAITTANAKMVTFSVEDEIFMIYDEFVDDESVDDESVNDEFVDDKREEVDAITTAIAKNVTFSADDEVFMIGHRSTCKVRWSTRVENFVTIQRSKLQRRLSRCSRRLREFVCCIR